MALKPTPARCERAQGWVSLRLDGEVSELEDALLSAHLRRCAACAAYAEAVGFAVETLRAQPLERLGQPVVMPSRRRSIVRPAAIASVAAGVAAVAGVTTILSMQLVGRVSPAADVVDVGAATAANGDLAQLRALRVIQLGGRPPQRSGVGQFGAVLAQGR